MAKGILGEDLFQPHACIFILRKEADFIFIVKLDFD